ncbi:MAG: alkane 1-monooxygenase [Yoonia sp.]|nr:alkane 1-monooxygenase [Yoonia sp.]
MITPMRLFTLATLAPTCLIAGAAISGGIWVAMAVFYLTALTSILDRLVQIAAPTQEFPSGNGLSVTLALAHFALLPLVVAGLAGDGPGAWEKLGLFFAAGLFFGQVSNANAHELIHRGPRHLHRLGMWVYITLLFGHHTSAHVLVHHRHVATRADPNTSRRGESFYRYALRAWVGSFRKGYRAEATRLTQMNRPAWRNPYLVYTGGAVICVALAVAVSTKALAYYVALAGYAQMQLLMSDYVQHYGLTRAINAQGKPQPVGAEHSWNSPHWFSSALLLNATRHSDHHAHPTRHYPSLTLPKDAPMLPKPLPLMAAIALVPQLWHRMMHPALDRLRHA